MIVVGKWGWGKWWITDGWYGGGVGGVVFVGCWWWVGGGGLAVVGRLWWWEDCGGRVVDKYGVGIV